MASRVLSSLPPGANQFREERVSGTERNDSQNHRHGLKRKISLRDGYKRKLLALPPQQRQKAIDAQSRKIVSLKRTPLKRESKGHKAELAKYNASAAAFFVEHPDCEICIRLREDGENIVLQKATERHHVRGRIGRLLNWKPGQMVSCRAHRTWPHDNPTRARKLGILCEAKDWNVFPLTGK